MVKFRSWKTLKSHGKHHGKSWNFKRQPKRVQTLVRVPLTATTITIPKSIWITLSSAEACFIFSYTDHPICPLLLFRRAPPLIREPLQRREIESRSWGYTVQYAFRGLVDCQCQYTSLFFFFEFSFCSSRITTVVWSHGCSCRSQGTLLVSSYGFLTALCLLSVIFESIFLKENA